MELRGGKTITGSASGTALIVRTRSGEQAPGPAGHSRRAREG
jgi:hypothetical protein